MELRDFGPPLAIASGCGEYLVTIRADADKALWIVEDHTQPLRTDRLDAMAQVWRTSPGVPPVYWIIAGAPSQLPKGAVGVRVTEGAVDGSDGPTDSVQYETKCDTAGWLIALPACADQNRTYLAFYDEGGNQVERTFRLGPPLSDWLGNEGQWTSYGPLAAQPVQ